MRQPTPEEWSIIRDHFDRLCALPDAEQMPAIDRAGLDPFVAGEVHGLLTAVRRAGMLDAPLSDSADDLSNPYASLDIGTTIDGYTISKLIGRGGMGEVYLAERAGIGFAQRVALKMLRPEAVERMASFDSERALLATLEHPGIARLIDGGIAPDGRPYMVIEYVEGDPITQWCAARDADLDTRLRLFLGVCDAVAHAHARMIIHRDIKPANIMIDGEARARLLDFGLAKLIDAASGERTVTMAMLTPDYAAPEQLMNDETTTATDIYSLGAVLFELLTGSRPWQRSGARLPSMLRRALDDDPPIPSRAAAGNPDAPVLARRIAGDLDSIILKAMRRVPGQRYPTVAALAADVRAYLALRPVAARSGSSIYLLGRYLRRHRWVAVGAAAALLALIGGTAGILWQARQTAVERDFALVEAARVEAVNRAMLLMFRDAKDMRQLESISARELVDGTTRRMLQSAPTDSPEAASMVVALADLYLILERNDDAKALITGALGRGIGRRNPPDLARLQLKLGTILAIERKHEEARGLLAEADLTWRRDPVRFRRERVEAVAAEALMLRHQGKTDAAIALLAGNMDEAEQVYVAYDRDLATRYTSLAGMLIDRGRLDQAAEVLARGDARLTRRDARPSSSGLNLRWLEAEVLVVRGEPAQAEQLLRDTIALRRRHRGPSGELAIDLLRYGRLLNQLDRAAEGLAVLRTAAPIATEYFGDGSDANLQIRIATVEALAALGRVQEAQRVFDLVTQTTNSLRHNDLLQARYLRSRAALHFARGDVDLAIADLNATEIKVRNAGRGADLFRRETAVIRGRLPKGAAGRSRALGVIGS
jgi:non-specific serine/threonine protein kinase/serine/threonine-protein kinase